MKYDVVNGYNRQSQYSYDNEREAVDKLVEVCRLDESGLRFNDTFIAIYDDDDVVKICRRVDDFIWVPERKWKRWLSRKLKDEGRAEEES